MLAKTSGIKIKKFFAVAGRLAEKSSSASVAMIISKKDAGADAVAAAELSDDVIRLRADRAGDEVEAVAELAKAMERGKRVFLEIGDYLHPAIYNAVYLLSSAGRIEYNTPKERVVARPAKGAVLVLFANEADLNKLNYNNLLNLVGLVERI